jgi:hypothetical protein
LLFFETKHKARKRKKCFYWWMRQMQRVKNDSLLKSFLTQFWNCFVVLHRVHASLHLELKTRPRFCLVSQSLPVVFVIVCNYRHLRNESVGFKRSKQLLEHQKYLLLSDIWWSKIRPIIYISPFYQHYLKFGLFGSLGLVQLGAVSPT